MCRRQALRALHSSPCRWAFDRILWAFVPFPALFEIWFLLALLGGSVFLFSDQMYLAWYEVSHNSALVCSHTHTKKVKISVSIYVTLRSNINFLHHPKILRCWKAITKYINMLTHVYLHCVHIHVLISPIFWCIFDNSLIIEPSSIKIQLPLTEFNEGLFTAPSSVHISPRCACRHLCAWPQKLLINSGDQFWHMLKDSKRYELICLIYWGVLLSNTSVVEHTS